MKVIHTEWTPLLTRNDQEWSYKYQYMKLDPFKKKKLFEPEQI